MWQRPTSNPMMYKDVLRPLDVLIQSPSGMVRRKTYLQSDDVQRCSNATERANQITQRVGAQKDLPPIR